MIDVNNKKVIIGLSGGVDSAVSMLLLREKGAIVEALHMTNWDDDDQYCSAAEDLQDAKNYANNYLFLCITLISLKNIEKMYLKTSLMNTKKEGHQIQIFFATERLSLGYLRIMRKD